MPKSTKAGTVSRPARSTVELIQQLKEAGELRAMIVTAIITAQSNPDRGTALDP